MILKFVIWESVISLPYNKNVDLSRLKSNFIMAEMMKFVLYRAENIVRKGENDGDLHFLPFPQWFCKACFSGFGLFSKGLILVNLMHDIGLVLHKVRPV